MNKKFIMLLLGTLFILTGCQSQASKNDIDVVTREMGSGTRTAFVDLVNIKDSQGEDDTYIRAIVQNSTNGVIQLVNGDKNAIGYISFGSLNDHLKDVKVDGVEISTQSILNKDYTLARPFNLAWKKGSLNDLTADFLAFIHSNEGQEIVETLGFVRVKEHSLENAYVAAQQKGSIEIVGSTSLTPIVEQLGEAYRKYNPQVKINITSNGSSAGMEATLKGVADFGMSSRDLSPSEMDQLEHEAIALDGIAIIVNPNNALDNLSTQEIKGIFSGEIISWDQLNN